MSEHENIQLVLSIYSGISHNLLQFLTRILCCWKASSYNIFTYLLPSIKIFSESFKMLLIFHCCYREYNALILRKFMKTQISGSADING